MEASRPPGFISNSWSRASAISSFCSVDFLFWVFFPSPSVHQFLEMDWCVYLSIHRHWTLVVGLPQLGWPSRAWRVGRTPGCFQISLEAGVHDCACRIYCLTAEQDLGSNPTSII